MKSRLLLLTALSLAVVTARGLENRDSDDSDVEPGDQVRVMANNQVAANETVRGDCVTVMGDLTLDGSVNRDCVDVLGDAIVNGTVHHDLVVIGDLKLGPKAHIDHDVVCIGHLDRDPGAFIGHDLVNPLNLGHVMVPFHHVRQWWEAGGHRGQYLLLAPGLFWLWSLSLASLLISILIAAIVPGPVRNAGELVVERPGVVILCGLAAIVGVPLALVCLLATVIGIPFAIVLAPISIIFPVWFGRAALYSLVARRLCKPGLAPALEVLIGGLLFLLLFLLPFFGVLIHVLLTFLAWCCAWAAFFGSRKRLNRTAPPPPRGGVPPAANYPLPVETPPPPPVSPLEAPPSSPFEASAGAAAASVPPPPPGAPAAAPALNLNLLPRAGFWHRIGALLIDVILVAIGCNVLESMFGHGHGSCDAFLVVIAAYGAIMWKLRGTTVGGIICHLTVVRLDGRPIDWPTAVVRALGCFVSLFVAGLGFLWIIFDADHQSWHDKIAGTAVVVSPNRQSLV